VDCHALFYNPFWDHSDLRLLAKVEKKVGALVPMQYRAAEPEISAKNASVNRKRLKIAADLSKNFEIASNRLMPQQIACETVNGCVSQNRSFRALKSYVGSTGKVSKMRLRGCFSGWATK
jgi:hypothetical protein